jgi:hypothetical protein
MGRRLTWAWTLARSSPMRPCAAFDSDWVKTNEVVPWIVVAIITTPISGSSRSVLRFAITPSTRNFVEAGRARPATRLTAISTRLIDNRPRWGRAVSTIWAKRPQDFRVAQPQLPGVGRRPARSPLSPLSGEARSLMLAPYCRSLRWAL